jgi:hypothetical protein
MIKASIEIDVDIDFSESTVDDVFNNIRDFNIDLIQMKDELFNEAVGAGVQRIKEINSIVELCHTGK